MKKSLLFLCLGLSSMLVFVGCNKTETVEEEPVVQEEAIVENVEVVEEPAEADEVEGEKVLYKYSFCKGYYDQYEAPYFEKYIYDEDGNYVKSEYYSSEIKYGYFDENGNFVEGKFQDDL